MDIFSKLFSPSITDQNFYKNTYIVWKMENLEYVLESVRLLVRRSSTDKIKNTAQSRAN